MNDTMRIELLERPWLEPFLEPDDETLEPAEQRWDEAVEIATRELERLGIHVYRRMKPRRGIETTALLVTPEER